MRIELLEDLYAKEIAALVDAEKQALQISPRMIESAQTEAVREALIKHMSVTEGQLKKLQPLIRRVEGPPIKAAATAGLIAEMEEVLRSAMQDPALRETALVMTARKMEAHEVACYAGAAEVARMIGYDDDASILEGILHEEQKMCDLLTGFAATLTLEAVEEEYPATEDITSDKQQVEER